LGNSAGSADWRNLKRSLSNYNTSEHIPLFSI
jgi:hypothetical protein